MKWIKCQFTSLNFFWLKCFSVKSLFTFRNWKLVDNHFVPLLWHLNETNCCPFSTTLFLVYVNWQNILCLLLLYLLFYAFVGAQNVILKNLCFWVVIVLACYNYDKLEDTSSQLCATPMYLLLYTQLWFRGFPSMILLFRHVQFTPSNF